MTFAWIARTDWRWHVSILVGDCGRHRRTLRGMSIFQNSADCDVCGRWRAVWPTDPTRLADAKPRRRFFRRQRDQAIQVGHGASFLLRARRNVLSPGCGRGNERVRLYCGELLDAGTRAAGRIHGQPVGRFCGDSNQRDHSGDRGGLFDVHSLHGAVRKRWCIRSAAARRQRFRRAADWRFIYVSSAGALTVGHNVTASCGGVCIAQGSVTAFPADAIPLFTWSATNGSWDANGGADQRAFLSSKSVTAGVGITSTEISGKTQLSADTSVIGLRTAAPGTSSTACTTGSWATRRIVLLLVHQH